MNPRAALAAAVLLLAALPGGSFASTSVVETQIQLQAPGAFPNSTQRVTHDGAPSTVSDEINVPSSSRGCSGHPECGFGADGSAAAFADAGLLGASSAGNAFGVSTGGASFDAVSSASWIESITITSSSLPIGAQAQGNAVLRLDGVTGFDTTGLDDTVSFDVTFQSGLALDGQPLGLLCVDAVDTPGCGGLVTGIPFEVQLVIPVTVTVGQTYSVESTLNVAVLGVVNTLMTGSGTLGVSADGLHTMHTYLQALGDFSFVAESGHDYSLPVPEPESLALLGLGLVALRARASSLDAS